MAGKFDKVVFSYSPKSIYSDSIIGLYELDMKTKGIAGRLYDHLDLDEKKGLFEFTAKKLATSAIAKNTIQKFILYKTKHLLTD